MKQASQEIANHPARMHAAEREGFVPRLEISFGRPKRGRRRAAASKRTKSWSGNARENARAIAALSWARSGMAGKSFNLYKLETEGPLEVFELFVGNGLLLGPCDIGESGDDLAAVIFVASVPTARDPCL